jgi:FkbM family methyltransferase
MKENFVKSGTAERMMHIKWLYHLWRALPEKLRFIISQQFSLISNSYEELTRMLIDVLEDKSYSFPKSEKLDKALNFLKKNEIGIISPDFREIWLEKDTAKNYFYNFNGARIPYYRKNTFNETLRTVFIDTFLFSLFLNDDYSAELVEKFEQYMPEGPYGYTEDDFDVTVKPGDVVIDAGAWIGDFSAFAASKGAFAYAFEPTLNIFKMLQKTAELNSGGGGGFTPVNKGLGSSDGMASLCEDRSGNEAGNRILIKAADSEQGAEEIAVITLDKFVQEQNLKRIDFIKADIEGAERDMLLGGRGVLKEFAPRLALCTYHLPDDPQVMESLILESNPRYKVKHISHKLFAAVL